MSVLVSCECGKQLRVPDDYIGQRIKCPACGATRIVEGVAADSFSTAPQPEASLIAFECGTCGKSMQARAEYAGRQTRCPGCQSVVTISGHSVLPSSGLSRPQLRQIPNLRRPTNPSLAPYLAGALLLLLVLAAVGAYFLMNNGFGGADGSVTDLDLVPADAQGILRIRVADVWNKPIFQQIIRALPVDADFMRKMNGDGNQIGAAGIDCFTLVIEADLNNRGEPPIWGALQFNRPTNAARFPNDLQAQSADGQIETKSAGGRTYYLVKLPPQLGGFGNEQLAFSLIHDRLCICGYEGNIVNVLERGTNVAKEGRLADVLKQAAGNEPLVFGLLPQVEWMAELANELKQQIDEPCDAIAEIQKLTWIGTLDKNLALELSATLPDGQKAELVVTALDAGRRKLGVMLGFAKLGFPALIPVQTAVSQAKITRAETEAKVKTLLDGQALVNAARQIPR